MCFPTTWHARNAPVRLVSMMSRHSSSVISSVGTRLILAAQLTRMSIFPKCWREAAASCLRDSRSQRSQVNRRVWRPRASISEATSSTLWPLRADATISAPASARPRLNARPMPDVPPMMTATLPARLMLVVGILFRPQLMLQTVFSDHLESSEQLLHGLLLSAADRDAPRICWRFKSSQLTVQQAGIHVLMVPFPDAFF